MKVDFCTVVFRLTRRSDVVGMVKEMQDFFGEAFCERGRGIYGYLYSAELRVVGYGTVGVCAWGGNSDTFMLSLSGGGCDLYLDWLFDYVRGKDFSCTRLDIAFDWRGDVPGFAFFERETREYSVCRSVWRKVVFNDRIDEGGMDGWTIYLGKSSSNRLRVYDKAAEQGLEGVSWVRIEYQLKRSSADSVFRAVLDGRPDDALHFILSIFDFREHDNVRAARRSRREWWARLIQYAGRSVRPPGRCVHSAVERLSCGVVWARMVFPAVVRRLAGAWAAGATLSFDEDRVAEAAYCELLGLLEGLDNSANLCIMEGAG